MTTPVPVPSGKWVQFEVLLRKATDDTGRFAVWQDGALIVDIENVQTAENDWAQWNVGASSDELVTLPTLMYVAMPRSPGAPGAGNLTRRLREPALPRTRDCRLIESFGRVAPIP